ncbi:uncharacterized protein RJT21DRAFT_116326 [Scheffersomyces amazonensis]|uniref:uncharacterized protein n=1 Tax=Scheffersomyces amazonensis TaxID=1078765 RepID=UPI00315CF36F
MNQLFKRAWLISPGSDNPIIHRKLNTFIHTSFTIISPIKYLEYGNSRFRKKFQVFVDEGPFHEMNDAHYIKVAYFEDHEFFEKSMFEYRVLEIEFTNRTNIQTYINDIQRNKNFICLFKQLKISAGGHIPDEIIIQLKGIFFGINSLCLEIYKFHEQICLYSNVKISKNFSYIWVSI